MGKDVDWAQMTNPKPDLFGHLHKNTEGTPKGRMLLYSEARLIIGAGRLVFYLYLAPEDVHVLDS